MQVALVRVSGGFCPIVPRGEVCDLGSLAVQGGMGQESSEMPWLPPVMWLNRGWLLLEGKRFPWDWEGAVQAPKIVTTNSEYLTQALPCSRGDKMIPNTP